MIPGGTVTTRSSRVTIDHLAGTVIEQARASTRFEGGDVAVVSERDDRSADRGIDIAVGAERPRRARRRAFPRVAR